MRDMGHGIWGLRYGFWGIRFWNLEYGLYIYRLDRMPSHDQFLYPGPTDLAILTNGALQARKTWTGCFGRIMFSSIHSLFLFNLNDIFAHSDMHQRKLHR